MSVSMICCQLCFVSDLFFVVHEETCCDVATSIDQFHFILIDVGHHLGVGRVSRSRFAGYDARRAPAGLPAVDQSHR